MGYLRDSMVCSTQKCVESPSYGRFQMRSQRLLDVMKTAAACPKHQENTTGYEWRNPKVLTYRILASA